MTEPPTESSEGSTTDRRQLVAAIILGLAAALTSFASYNASVTGGEAENLRTDAGRTLADANFFYSQSNQVVSGDQSLFVAYATAAQEGNEQLTTYLTTLMRPALVEAVGWWIQTDEANTPFDTLDGNPYTVDELFEAQSLEEDAEQQVSRAEAKDEKEERYDLATVLLALTLFFAGIATLFRRRLVARLMLGVSVLTMAGGAGVLAQGFLL